MRRNAAAVLVLLSALCFRPCVSTAAETGPEVLTRVLAASGLDQIGSRNRIAFTFNVKAGENEASRRWDWSPADDRVLQDGAEVGKLPKFINDAYWLLFPVMVQWDLEMGKVQTQTQDEVPGPLTGEPCTEVVVTYTDGVGATPNDVYKLYVDAEGRIREWSYHRAGAEAPTRATTWEGYETIGGLQLSLDRRGPGFRVWFTDVIVE